MKDPYFEAVVTMACLRQTFERPTDSDWDKVESDLGVVFPLDFKRLVSKLWSGEFGGLSLLNPASSSEYTKLDAGILEGFRKSVGPIATEAGFHVYPEPGGFVCGGIADNRMDLLILPVFAGQQSCTLIWLVEDDWAAYRLDISVSRFLHDLYLGLMPGAWAQEARSLLWGPGQPFFTPRPGTRTK